MKSARNAGYLQIDNKIRNLGGKEGLVIMPSTEAWEKVGWSRKFFSGKPKEGYFIWVKKQLDFPLSTCVTIESPKIAQELSNLLVIEEGINARANVLCNSAKDNLCGTHKASGKLVLKDNASLEYNHIHKWGREDFVNPDYEFILGRNSKLTYNYKNLLPPKELVLKTVIYAHENSSASMNVVINALNSKVQLKEDVFLKEKNSNGVVRLRLVGRKGSSIDGASSIIAESACKGHLDCQGLLVDDNASISLTPKLVDKDKNALLSHEASIGKIAEEQLDYLRARGLSEKEAIDLIVGGFLGK
jgi:Fe-S cluster assembly scaffold protein SufB